MSRHRTISPLRTFSYKFFQNVQTTVLIAIFLSLQLMNYERCTAVAITSQSTTSMAKAEKLGAFMERQPESTIAPLYDEVQFECGLNFKSDQIVWRFRPQNQRSNSVNSLSDFSYLNKEVTQIDKVKFIVFYFNARIVFCNLFCVLFSSHFNQ